MRLYAAGVADLMRDEREWVSEEMELGSDEGRDVIYRNVYKIGRKINVSISNLDAEYSVSANFRLELIEFIGF